MTDKLPVEYRSTQKHPTGSLPEELVPEIDRIVRKYPYSDSSLLFKSELLDLAERWYEAGRADMANPKCPHIFKRTTKNEFYCPNCGLCMEITEKDGKLIGTSWKDTNAK